MRPECEVAIKAAAGRELTKSELAGIEERVLSSMRELRMKDEAAFRKMSPAERMVAAADIAKTRFMEAVVFSHESALREAAIKQSNISYLDRVTPGLRGKTHALYKAIDGIGNKVDTLARTLFSRIDSSTVDKGKFFGMIHDPEKSLEVMKARFGQDTTPEGRTAWAEIQKINDEALARAKAAGIPIHELEDYGTPQPQAPHKVALAGREQYVDDMMAWVDRSRYVNGDGTMMDDRQIRGVLMDAYESIRTDGASKTAKGQSTGFGGLVGDNKNAPRRIFFKDAESWMAAMTKYGESTNVWNLTSSHVRGLAKDIVLAENFGRHAEDNIRQLLAKAKTEDLATVSSKGDFNSLQSLHNRTSKMWDAVMHPDRPENAIAANYAVQLRGLMASSQLGSLWGALPDLAGMKMAAEYHGLPEFKLMRQFFDNLTSSEEKAFYLHKIGLWQQGFMHGANRMAADEFRNGFGTFLNEATHRLMGLESFDRGMRTGVGLVAMDTLGDLTRRMNLAQADGATRMLQQNGVAEHHWAVWQLAQPESYRGNEQLLTPTSIDNIPDHLLAPLAEQRVAERGASFKAEIERRQARVQTEQSWIASRAEKIQAAKEKANAFLEELRNRRAGAVGTAAELENVRALLLSNMLRQLEVNHDFLAAHATEAAQGKMSKILTKVEDGAPVEAQPAPANRPGVEQGQRGGRATPGMEDVAAGQIQDYGRAINQAGEGLGKVRAQIEASIKEGKAKLRELEKTLDLKTDAREKANAERFQEKLAALEKFAEEINSRAERHQDYIDAFQAKLGKLLGEEISNLRNESKEKLMETIGAVQQFGARGASMSSLSDKAAMGTLSQADAGTWMGEIKRFMLQFKSVPIGIFRAHWEAAQALPSISTKNVWGSKQAYMARFVGYSTLMGALAVELKSMNNGQNPRNMNITTDEGKKFWMEAFASGGGFGMYGDLFAHGGETQSGRGLESLMGPGVGLLGDTYKQLQIARDEAMKGESKNPYALSAVRIVRRNMVPFANLWYTKAAFNRLVYDAMQDKLSPGSSVKQEMRMRQRGSTYWWRPGTPLPQSSPDLSKAFSDQ